MGYLISRGIYSAALPRVSSAKADNRSLFHRVSVSGVLVQDADGGIYVPSGLAVKSVRVQQGDYVKTGDVLFVLEEEFIINAIEELKLQLSKLNLQEEDLTANNRQNEIDKQTQISRLEKQQRDFEAWKSDMQLARDELYSLADKIDGLVGQLTELKEKLQESENENSNINAESVSGGNAQTNPSRSEEDIKLQALFQEKQKELEELSKAKMQTERRIQNLQENTVLDPGYAVEDAKRPLLKDSGIEQLQLDKVAIEKRLMEYQNLLDSEGEILAKETGNITGIYVQAGTLTTTQAAITFASDESPIYFEVLFSPEQMKYLSKGMNITVMFNGQSSLKKQLTYLIESASGDGNFMGRILMENEDGVVGQMGSVEAIYQTENYACCIPIEAVYLDGRNRNFVYVQEKTEGFFGTELVARKIYVTILDQNEAFAAVEPGILDKDSEVIRYSSKELSDGCIVRPE